MFAGRACLYCRLPDLYCRLHQALSNTYNVPIWAEATVYLTYHDLDNGPCQGGGGAAGGCQEEPAWMPAQEVLPLLDDEAPVEDGGPVARRRLRGGGAVSMRGMASISGRGDG